MEIATLGAILILRVIQNISSKSNSRYMPDDTHGIVTYLSIRMGISSVGAAVLLLLSGNVLRAFADMTPVGLLIAVGTGITLTASTICSLLVLRGSSLVLSTLFGASGLLVPTVAGIFLFGQSVSLGQWLGIACLLFAAVLLSSSSQKTNGRITVKTALLLLGLMLFNGGTMLLQTLYKMYAPQGSVALYSFMQFCIPAVVLLLVSLTFSVKNKTPLPKMGNKLMGFTVLSALAVLGVSQISTIASGFIPVSILFPISDGGNTVISAVMAALMFKERFTVKSVCGLAAGVVGIVMIKLMAG